MIIIVVAKARFTARNDFSSPLSLEFSLYPPVIPALSRTTSAHLYTRNARSPHTNAVTLPPRFNHPLVSLSLSLSLSSFLHPSFYSSSISSLSLSLSLFCPRLSVHPCRRQPRKRGTTDRKIQRERKRTREGEIKLEAEEGRREREAG